MQPDLVREEVFRAAKTVVVKIGTNVLTDHRERLDREQLYGLARQLDGILRTGRRLVLVSSGAVGAGLQATGLQGRPRTLPELQAAAAVGQPRLLQAWSDAFGEYSRTVAQVLLTGNDFRQRRRYLNVRNTVRALCDRGIVPVVNENDTVSVREITFGDNDQLAVMMATLVPDPLLIILSGVDGLYDGPPSSTESQVISTVQEPDEGLQKFVSRESSTLGRGGMAAKLTAICEACRMGESVILANGRQRGILDAVRTAQPVGTLFPAVGQSQPAWKRWLGFATVPAGALRVDAGAASAVRRDGRSLLAVGIRQVDGSFSEGDLVSVLDPEQIEIARGLVNYSSDVLKTICGKRTEEIACLLGSESYGEVIHRDNLVLR